MSVRVAVLGCGAITVRAHLPSLRRAGADVTVFASRTRESALAAASAWGGGEVTTDWRAALRRDDVDAVLVNTPNALHESMTLEAARAGKHVLVEKPMATSVAAAGAMIAAARDAGVVLMVAHNMRFQPAVLAMRDALVRGEVGEALSFRAALGHAGPLAWSARSTWFLDTASAGGGALIDLGIHVADTLRFLLGDDAVECAALLHRPAPGGAEDSADLVLRLAGGAVGSLHAAWNTVAAPDVQITVVGTAGTLHLDAAMSAPLLRRPGRAEAEPLPLPAETGDPTVEFVRAVAEGVAHPPTAEDGRAALAIVEAAYRAAASGATVHV